MTRRPAQAANLSWSEFSRFLEDRALLARHNPDLHQLLRSPPRTGEGFETIARRQMPEGLSADTRPKERFVVMLHTLSRPVNQEKEDLPYALLTGEPLRCPSCGGEYLHHGCVSVFGTLEDNSERFRKTRLTSVHGDDVPTGSPPRSEPVSPTRWRRDRILVRELPPYQRIHLSAAQRPKLCGLASDYQKETVTWFLLSGL